MWYLLKNKICAGLYCYSPNNELIDTHMGHVPSTYSCKPFVHFDVWKTTYFHSKLKIDIFCPKNSALLSQNNVTQAKLILEYDWFCKTTLRTH